MAEHVIKKGLDIPISGKPEQSISDSTPVRHVALVGHDYPLMKPRMQVQVGDKVQRGQLLFEDRKSEGVRFTAPGSGTVKAIHRGEKRLFQSLVIELDETETQVDFEHYAEKAPKDVTGEEARALLGESGLWTAIRMRPFSRIPSTGDTCKNLFVTAIDTNPLAPSVEAVIDGGKEHFLAGLQILSTLTEGKVFVCVGSDWSIDLSGQSSNIQKETFRGPHPAGLVGTHIHMLAPVNRENPAWHVGYQDVLAIGELFLTGKLNPVRVIALAGPGAKSPRLLRTRIGASIAELTEGETLDNADVRVISGSLLFGHTATEEPLAFLNRYDQQIGCLEEDRERVFFGWLSPGMDKFSTIRTILGGWLGKNHRFTTSTHGSHRAMVPIGMFERVMPLDILPTFLLRSIVVGDVERAEQLGCLELHEEDLALCTFVSPGKTDFGKALRSLLTTIWSEG